MESPHLTTLQTCIRYSYPLSSISMKFGERLLSSQHPQWSESYIDYLRLKLLLNSLFDLEASPEEGGSPRRGCTSPLHHNISPNNSSSTNRQDVTRVASSHSFQKELDREIRKALLFLMKSMGELASDLSSLSEQQRFLSIHASGMLDENNNMNESPQKKQQKKRLIQQKLQEIDHLRMEYIVRIGSKLLLLLEFVELNIEAIIKIVKKHDKNLSKWEESCSSHLHSGASQVKLTRLRRQYLPRFAVYSSDPNVRCLFLAAADAGDCNRDNSRVKQSHSDGNFGGWDAIQWNLEKSLRELFHWEISLKNVLDECSADESKVQVPPELQPLMPISSRSFSEISLAIYRGSPIKKFLTHSSSILGLSTDLSSSRLNEASFFEPIIYQIQSSRKRLGQMHHRYIRMVYAHEMLHLVDDKNLQQDDEQYLFQRKEDFGSVEKLEKIRKQSIGGEDEGNMWMKPYPTVSRLSKYLNLASAGLYMCNYNICAPTAGSYAKMLGFDPANAGIIIGMTPAAVILSSILYSWWSSYSYKRALVFASFCCSVGNIVYALALPCNSLTMVLLGRMLTGFGSARVINRRYIGEWWLVVCAETVSFLSTYNYFILRKADYYSIEDRTSGMADFVSASALGMALGPGLAASLSIIAPADLSDTNSFWTIETAPGYIMFILWSIYLICNILFFEEPDRIGHSAKLLPSLRTKPTIGEGSQDATTTAPTESGESSPLLNATNGSFHGTVQSGHPLLSFCGNIPVLISLLLLLLLKCVLEGISSSAPTVSLFYFGWGVHASGIYLALLASFVLPTNFVIAYISRRFDDRELILGTLMMMFVGILGFLVYSEDGDEYSEARFILFGLVTFVACNALEGPTMGLLSKTIPKTLARGILNAGLLATEAGTLGRVIGDFWLSSATFMGLDEMVNRTFEPMCMMVGVSIFATFWSYPHLQPRFEDEDDD
ncbi:hypothetical protein ACHAXR_006599 [Thalassiosira sp. AJA248-18]